MYDAELLARNMHPENRGVMEDANIQKVLVNASCGDELAISLKIRDGIVIDGAWEGHACAIAQASAEYFIDMIKGRKVAELGGLGWQDVPELKCVKRMPARVKCAELPWKMVKFVVE